MDETENIVIERVGKHFDQTAKAIEEWLNTNNSVGKYTISEIISGIENHASMIGIPPEDLKLQPVSRRSLNKFLDRHSDRVVKEGSLYLVVPRVENFHTLGKKDAQKVVAVSYTHLTLPTN